MGPWSALVTGGAFRRRRVLRFGGESGISPDTADSGGGVTMALTAGEVTSVGSADRDRRLRGELDAARRRVFGPVEEAGATGAVPRDRGVAASTVTWGGEG
ncbi:MAG: hypothetical protein L3J97_06610 [Thermoplasmata archaeon]|nr:hypothetical protein [Thermoplasmata archaeon]